MCSNDHKNHFNDVERTIKDPNVSEYDKLRLAIIYALRYQNKGKDKASNLRTLLRNNVQSEEVARDYVNTLDIMLRHFGSNKREMNLFEEEKSNNGGIIGKLGSIAKAVGGMDEVQNIYTQHNPLLHHIIEDAVKCKLPYSQFPSFHGTHKQQLRQFSLFQIVCAFMNGFCLFVCVYMDRPRHIIIYFIGGATFEEAETVNQLNKQFGKSTEIVLGSGSIHNSKSFIQDIQKTYGRNIID